MSPLTWPARYEIRVDGVLDRRWTDWFGGLRVQSDGAQTVMVGLLADQPALHGILAKIRDLGLGLLSVRRIDPPDPPAAGERSPAAVRDPGPHHPTEDPHHPTEEE